MVAFDLLSLEGDDLRQRPLEERRDALWRLVRGVDDIQFSEAIEAEGAVVFAYAVAASRPPLGKPPRPPPPPTGGRTTAASQP